MNTSHWLLAFVTTSISALALLESEATAAPYTDEYGNTTPGWAPAWCGTYRGASGTGYMSVDDDLAKEGYFAERPMRSLAQAQCEFRKDPGDTAKIRATAAKYRAEFRAVLGLDDADMDALLSMHINQQQTNKIEAAACKRFQRIDPNLDAKASSTESNLARVTCRSSSSSEYDWFDASAVSQVAFAVQCFRSLADSVDSPQEAQRPWQLASYARCEAVGALLDQPAYLTELAAAKLEPFARIWAKAQFTRAQTARKKVRAYYGDLAGKDPILAEVLVTAPKAAAAAFAAMRTEEPKLIDQTALMLANFGKRRIVAGQGDCSAPYLEALATRFAKAAPATLDAARDLFDAPLIGYLTAGFAMCEGNAKRDSFAAVFAEKVGALPVGPRDAVLWGAMQAIAAHREEIEGAAEFRGMSFASRPRLDYRAGFAGRDSGVIAKVSAPSDGVVKVTFKKESWMEPVWKCRDTNRIDHVKFEGDRAQIVYRQSCVQAGERKVEKLIPPTDVDVRFASALKTGRFAVMRLASGSTTGFPEEVWSNKARKALVGYYGFGWQ